MRVMRLLVLVIVAVAQLVGRRAAGAVHAIHVPHGL
jgi:hypothetical protein